jgi:hypothetical protein
MTKGRLCRPGRTDNPIQTNRIGDLVGGIHLCFAASFVSVTLMFVSNDAILGFYTV